MRSLLTICLTVCIAKISHIGEYFVNEKHFNMQKHDLGIENSGEICIPYIVLLQAVFDLQTKKGGWQPGIGLSHDEYLV